jgi:hypothetical protein
MPGFNLGLNQRNFNGTRPTSAAAINMGTMRGKGSTSRMFNYCTQRSANPSECINQFINIKTPPIPSPPSPPPPPPPSYTFTGTGALTQAIVSNYFLNGGTAEVIFIEGYTSIDVGAFQFNTQITSVTIDNSVTSIGTSAFYGCSSLISVIIPDSVITIFNEGFFGCSSLISVIIPDSVTSIGDLAFADCSTLTSVTITQTSNLTTIGIVAFTGTLFTSIIIPISVSIIAGNAFQNSMLSTVTIANNQVISGTTFLSPVNNPPGVAFFGRTVATVPP